MYKGVTSPRLIGQAIRCIKTTFGPLSVQVRRCLTPPVNVTSQPIYWTKFMQETRSGWSGHNRSAQWGSVFGNNEHHFGIKWIKSECLLVVIVQKPGMMGFGTFLTWGLLRISYRWEEHHRIVWIGVGGHLFWVVSGIHIGYVYMEIAWLHLWLRG